MPDTIVLTLTQDNSAPFILRQVAEAPFTLTVSNSSPINIQMGPSLNGLVNLIGPSSIRGFQFFVSGSPIADELLLASSAPYTFDLSLAESNVVSLHPATAQAVFTIQKTVLGVNTTIGTILFNINSYIGIITLIDPTITKGDLITILAPTIPDATLSDIAFLLAE